MMKCIALLLALLVQEDDKALRVRRAIEWYCDPDEQVRELGRKELIACGRDAVPHLEKLLKLRNALDIYRLLREVDRPQRPLDPAWFSGDEPLQDGEPEPGADRGETERYVRLKIAEARAAARRGNYQRGYDIAHALLLLEPHTRYAEQVRDIRRYCDNWLTQTALLRSRVVAPAPAAAGPDKYEFVLRTENMFRGGIRLVYESELPGQPPAAGVLVEITCEKFQPNGAVTEIRRAMEVPIEPDIPVAMGAQWEKTFTFDSAPDFDDEDYIRVYTIGAWTQPTRLEYGTGSTVKRIVFEPVTFRVVPKKHAHMLEKPLASLKGAIEVGTVNEAFIAALLVSEQEKPEAIELLVREMEAPEKPQAKHWIQRILIAMTGENLGTDPKRWREHAAGLKPEPKQKPKKQ